MKVIVLGGGLIGLTSAFFLRARGHEVTLLEREEGPGSVTSFANGALLTPSMSDPWNTPGCWRILLSSLGRTDAPLQLRWRELPGLVGWGVGFLKNSRTDVFKRNTLNNLRLAQSSLTALKSLRVETGIQYGQQARGTLRLFRDPAALERAWIAATSLAAHGLESRKLSRTETIALEPAMAPIASQLTGAIYYEADEIGDAYRFCLELAAWVRERGVDFRFRTQVTAVEVRSGAVSAVVTAQGRLVADRYVVAAGTSSAAFLRPVGVVLPIRPAKGYSLTFADSRSAPSLTVPIVDDDLHAVAVPLEGAIRVAGTAEFAGHDRSLPAARIRNLQRLVERLLPEATLDPVTAKPWCGLRAMSVDGVPVIGPTPLTNLFVNTGHGHLGWTLATGSGRLLAELICGDRPSIDPAPYALSRFGAS